MYVCVARTPPPPGISSLRSGAGALASPLRNVIRIFRAPIHPLHRRRDPFFFRSRTDTALEVLALRQQVAVLKRKRPRPALNSLDRFFWTSLRHLWSRWTDVLVIVKPETVVGWHRTGFGCTGAGVR